MSNKDIVYQKKELRGHIYDTPDTYAGSDRIETIVLDVFSEKNQMIKAREVKQFVQVLNKIVDEGMVNARDENIRTKTCNVIKVSVTELDGKKAISIYNNGRGISVEKHETEDVMKPELIFFHLLTSGNYNKEEKKIVGGKNGYGSKLIAIFSKKCTIKIIDPENKKKYIQTASDNMTKIGKPKISSSSNKTGSVEITFVPDYERFGLSDLPDEMFALFKKRTYDLAATVKKGTKVYFNDELISANTFPKYIDLYYAEKVVKVVDETNERWKIGAIYNEGTEFKQTSFVNGVATTEGGKHVDYIVNKIVKELTTIAKSKCKEVTIKPAMVKEGLHVFIDATIVNPSFTSQTKTFLSTPSDEFGSKYDLPATFIKKLAKTGIMDNIINTAKSKEIASIGKNSSGKKKKTIFVEKLNDAEYAGTAKSDEACLILTEGDSAATFAISGRKVIGNKKYGVFPLKGKILNVREGTIKQLKENKEINNLISIIGLKYDKEYTDTSSLRYGRVMILADQDYDGSHIKGLFMNFIHYFWPSLMKNVKNFIVSMPTPIVKARSGKKVETFYTIKEYEEWKETKKGKWTIKYYKGLGTSDAKEAAECFKDFENKVVSYEWTKEKCSENLPYEPTVKNMNEDAILLGFDGDRIPDRKNWLMDYDKNEILDNSVTTVPYYEFIHKDLKHFSNYDIERSIPSVVDGLKPSQRKILYGIIKKNLKGEIKVAQLAGYISEHCGYHHGEASLNEAIVGMARTFVGSNNINLLFPSGQFGSRLEGGKDFASPRYIFTYLTDIAKALFPALDLDILKYNVDDDGKQIEPEWFCPIIPMILVNGGKGIGTGFSTTVFSYNPKDIVANIKRLMKGKDLVEMTPWFRGFKGTIVKVAENKFESRGVFKQNDNKVKITELPVGVWTNKYKLMLEEMILALEGGSKKKKGNDAPKKKGGKTKKVDDDLVSFKSNIDDINIDFTLTLKDGVEFDENKFKLVKPISTTNMYLFNEKNVITKYKTAEDIIKAHYDVRIKTYTIRKAYILKKLKLVLELLKWKRKFIKDVLDEIIIINRKKKTEIIAKVEELGYPMLNEKDHNYVSEDSSDVSDGEGKSYNYITKLPLFSLTKDQIDKLDKEYNDTKKEYEELEAKTEYDLWNEELDVFLEAYEKLE